MTFIASEKGRQQLCHKRGQMSFYTLDSFHDIKFGGGAFTRRLFQNAIFLDSLLNDGLVKRDREPQKEF